MAERLPLIFLLASHLFVSGVLSMSILKIENKCNHTVWPVIYSWNSQVSTTGFTLSRVINAPSSWYGLISGRTLCSTDSTGNFLFDTRDYKFGNIECPGTYSWAPVTYVYFRIDNNGIISHTISVEYGYTYEIGINGNIRRYFLRIFYRLLAVGILKEF